MIHWWASDDKYLQIFSDEKTQIYFMDDLRGRKFQQIVIFGSTIPLQ